jgi:hypothetical protein
MIEVVIGNKISRINHFKKFCKSKIFLQNHKDIGYICYPFSFLVLPIISFVNSHLLQFFLHLSIRQKDKEVSCLRVNICKENRSTVSLRYISVQKACQYLRSLLKKLRYSFRALIIIANERTPKKHRLTQIYYISIVLK